LKSLSYIIDKKKGQPPGKAVPPPPPAPHSQHPNPPPAVSTMLNGFKPPTANVVTQPIATNNDSTPKSKQSKIFLFKMILLFIVETNTTKNQGFFATIGRRKKNTPRIDISAPVQSTYV
jgi:hypothetical protein